MGFYTLLRIIVTIGAVAVLVAEFNNEFSFWVLVFGIIALVFNPIIPVYLNDKGTWVIIDLLTGILFLIKALSHKTYNHE